MSLVLVFLMLGSTMSFSIDKHFCGDHLVDVAIFGEATPCAMELALQVKYGSEHTKKSDCCTDKKIVLEGQDELKIQFDSFDFEKGAELPVSISSYSFIFEKVEQHFVPFAGYPPPLITEDFHALYEHFLI